MVVSLVAIVTRRAIVNCLFFLVVAIVDIHLSRVLTLVGIYMRNFLGPKALKDHQKKKRR